MVFSNRFSALSADEPDLHEVDTTCDEMVPEASDAACSDLDTSSTCSHESETKPVRQSCKSKRGPGCAKHRGGPAPASQSTSEAGAEVVYLTSDRSCGQDLDNLEQSSWVEIKGVIDPRAADSVALSSVAADANLLFDMFRIWTNLSYSKRDEAGEPWRESVECDHQRLARTKHDQPSIEFHIKTLRQSQHLCFPKRWRVWVENEQDNARTSTVKEASIQ